MSTKYTYAKIKRPTAARPNDRYTVKADGQKIGYIFKNALYWGFRFADEFGIVARSARLSTLKPQVEAADRAREKARFRAALIRDGGQPGESARDNGGPADLRELLRLSFTND